MKSGTNNARPNMMVLSQRKQPAAPPVYRPQVGQKTIQSKMVGHRQSEQKLPVPPPVYRPFAIPKVLQKKSASIQQSQADQTRRPPVVPPVYRPQNGATAVQPRIANAAQTANVNWPKSGSEVQLKKQPVAPPVYRAQPAHNAMQPAASVPRPDAQRLVQPKTVPQLRKPPTAPPVYRPQARLVSVQAKMSSTPQIKNRPVAPPAYRPQTVPKVLQPKKTVAQQEGRRKQEPRNIGAGIVQRVVDPRNSDITSNGKYLVERDNTSVLYSTVDAAPPQPYGLYARGRDYIEGRHTDIPLNSWKPNVRFIDKSEVQAEPVLDVPGKFTYKKPMGILNLESTISYSIHDLQTEVWDPKPGRDSTPTVGALGKNDCNIWATTLQNLIADETGGVYLGRDQPRTVRVLSDETTQADLNVNVGDLMKHIYQGPGACNYHAATVVAKDGDSLVTLEGHVSKDLSRPQFHVRGGLTGFAAEGIEHNKGDRLEVIPVTSLTYDEHMADKEMREKRFREFNVIDEGFWRDYEGRMYSFRGRLAGDIGITPTREKQRRDELARRRQSEFDEIYRSDRQRHLEGRAPVYTSFPRIED